MLVLVRIRRKLFFKAEKEKVAKALMSFMLGSFEDRRRYEAALDAITDEQKREEFIALWQDGRSSINDIGTVAYNRGKAMLEDSRKE